MSTLLHPASGRLGESARTCPQNADLRREGAELPRQVRWQHFAPELAFGTDSSWTQHPHRLQGFSEYRQVHPSVMSVYVGHIQGKAGGKVEPRCSQ